MKKQTIRTTLTLPRHIIEATDQAVATGKAKSRNEFVAKAIQRELAAQKRADLDAVLKEMVQDPDYQSEVLKMDAEFTTLNFYPIICF